jgi:glutathione peroxidase
MKKSVRRVVLVFGLIIIAMMSFLGGLFGSDEKVPASIYDYKVKAIDGGEIDFAQFKGKKILIVNTASLCGLTPQFDELEQLYRAHKDKLVIVGFPANSFMFQEPGSDEKIATMCRTKFDVTFPMASKVSVKGKGKAPIYVWLTHKEYNGLEDNSVKWNFQKYLIDETGKLVAIFSPKTTPMDPEIIAAINK